MSDFALLFDGSQNYVSLGTMGNFGSNLGSGFYCKFQIKSTITSYSEMGYTGGQALIIAVGGYSGDGMRLYIRDNSSNVLAANVASPSIAWNDGNLHTLIYTANFTTQVITISVDGVSQTVFYENQSPSYSFVNFTGNPVGIGSALSGSFLACTLDNFQIGTSSSVLYGSYGFNEGTGTTTADASGNNNTGTLTGSPVPLWVTGLNAYGNVTGNFTFNGNLSLSNL